MASTINADNGVVSGSSGVKTTADTSGVLALQSNGSTGVTLNTDLSVTFAGAQTLSAGTANGVTYLNGSKVLTSGSALTFDGTNLALTQSGNPTMTVKTTGAGNNPLYRLQADTNYWDALGVFSDANDTLRFRYNGTDYLTLTNAGAIGVGSGLSYGTSGQVLTSAGSGAAPTWETPSAPVAGKLLASGNIDSSTGLATLSWATTGVKRLQVYLAGANAVGAGNIRIQVGDTTSIVTASNYRVQATEFDYATIGTGTATAATNWTLTVVSTTSWPCQMSAEIGLSASGLPSMLGRFGRIGAVENTLVTGDFNGTWNTAQFQSIQVTITGGSTYSGRVTVIGYTE